MSESSMILLVPALLMLAVSAPSVDAGIAIIYIDPSSITGLSVGATFPINVTVANVTDLYAWSFQICYKSEILNASSWASGPVFTSENVTALTVIWNDKYNQTHGLIQIDCTFVGEVPAFKGTTTLATVYFKVRSDGFTLLHLENTILLDDSTPFPQQMPHMTADGRFGAGAGDIAVIQVTLSKNIVSDTVVLVNATVANYGSLNETFNVTLYYDSAEISTMTVKDLAPSVMLSLNFTWNTTLVPRGNYTITVIAHPLPGEANPEDNTLTGGWIIKTILGDVTGDFKVDVRDIATIAKAYGTETGHPKYNPNADLDNDDKIDIVDIANAAKNYGKEA